jgi:hypothetical protein
MKRAAALLLSLLVAPHLIAQAGQHLVPAGALISCTVSEPKISSRTTAVGDPVLCQIGHSQRFGHTVIPYNSFMVGRFEEYKNPGHFVGKGYMELKFDRMIVEPDTVIPIDARVVDAPGYRVDNQGRILGKGHAVRDAVLWSIPILWPLDLLMLPMRGPTPTLKAETSLTLKVMDDLVVPNGNGITSDPYGLLHRQTSENNLEQAPPAVAPQPQQEMAYAEPQQEYAQPVAPQEYAYAQPAPVVYAYPQPVVYAPAPVMYAYPAPVMYAAPVVYSYAPRVYARAPMRAYAGVGYRPGGFGGGYGGGGARVAVGFHGGFGGRGFRR